MGSVKLTEFHGRAPKLAPANLPTGMSQIATSCRLWGEDLRAFKEPYKTLELSKTGIILSIFQYNNFTDWLHWTQDVNVARTPVANDTSEKIVFTGTDMPRITTKTLYDDGSPGTSVPPASYKLGIPAPAQPTVATNGAGVLNGVKNYVYTYVRKWPDNSVDEGPPSVPSANITPVAQQLRVTVSGGPTFADFGITHKRIYRIAVGTAGADYQFVAEITAATTTYDDNLADSALGEILPSENNIGPPDGMIGIIALPNGVMAGFKDNVLYLSEPYLPHAYPTENQYSVNYSIVALGNYDTTIVVATSAYPWVFYGADPAAMTPKRIPAKQPCASKRSMVSAEFGTMYASYDGLMEIGPAGVNLVTREMLTKQEWAVYQPTTIHAASYENGRYMAFYKTGVDSDGNDIGAGFIFDRREAKNSLIDLNLYADAVFQAPETTDIYLAYKDASNNKKNTVFKWDTKEGSAIPYTWRSKVLVSTSLDNFGVAMIPADYAAGLSAAQLATLAAQIAAIKADNLLKLDDDLLDYIGGDVLGEQGYIAGDGYLNDLPSASAISGIITFRLYGDGTLLYEKQVDSDEPFPLPGVTLCIEHAVEVSGQVPIREITIAHTAEDLGNV